MRKILLFATIAAAALPALAQPPSGNGEGQTITVTGRRIADYRAALAACLARHCPVNEDVDASLALAEALFLEGDYHQARTAVRQSLDRNHDAAAAFPEPVADLYRSNARIARHMGLDDEAHRATYNILRALRTGIPVEDYRHFTARLEIAEMQMMESNIGVARRELEQLARNARAAGREDVATIAELRSLWFDSIATPTSSARSRLVEMSRLTAPADRMRATGARILLARLYREEGRAAEADRMIAQVGLSNAGSSHRRLIRSPSYQLLQQEWTLPDGDYSPAELAAYGNTLHRASENFEGKWLDVGFWVLPDGTVSGLEVIRRGAPTDWAAPVLAAIRDRLYSTGPEATYRLERYTYTAGFDETAVGSRLPTRSPRARVELLDLTTEDAPPPPPPAPAPGAPANLIR